LATEDFYTRAVNPLIEIRKDDSQMDIEFNLRPAAHIPGGESPPGYENAQY
jgi:hypothetical protein